jgi:hypothetical protein
MIGCHYFIISLLSLFILLTDILISKGGTIHRQLLKATKCRELINHYNQEYKAKTQQEDKTKNLVKGIVDFLQK